ncbi:hypothetical protein AURDEDRAFT_166142 [Auricularia subglabra TFB-10046 SS5]|nr:hypothetical protein AURDEDRAFT_166142 [Auricularia subglabra TFB-10046 SS5]
MRERTLRDSRGTLIRSLSDVAKDSQGSPREMQPPTSPPPLFPQPVSSPPGLHAPSHSRDLCSDFLSPHSPACLSGAVGLVGVRKLSDPFSLPVTPPRATAHAHSLTGDTLASHPNTGLSALLGRHDRQAS